MGRRRNVFVQSIAAYASIAFCRVMALLPLPVCRFVGRAVGVLAYALVPRVRRVALENLRNAYGDTLTEREVRAIACGAAMNVGIVAAEFAHIPRLTPENIARWVTVEGAEHLNRDRPGFMLAAHLGNWEWMASVLKNLGFNVAEVVRPLDAPALNAYVDRIRTSRGVRTIDKTGGGQQMLKLLKDGWVVGVLADQSPRESAVPVTFFGRPCWATAAPAMVALRQKMPMVVVTMTRDARGHYTLRFSSPVALERTGDFRADLVAITQRCQDLIEEQVRAHPEQWLWLHRRWKARPRLEEEWSRKSGGTVSME
ncbi:MAG: lysophospholipid acyltransferase family protein [Candidatus Hydrogenedentes bacterium]|nr:lysophospholipid acyltransferase family protein [Candidatus Hydrogenedentota bacterium]